MNKLFLGICFSSIIFLITGCSLSGSSSGETGGVLKTSDSGVSWELKRKVDEKQTLAKVDALEMVIDPLDNNRIYLGTKDKGIVFSEDGVETWKKIKFPANKVYTLAVNYSKPSEIYASGVLGERGKIYKTSDYGEEWQEVYTEPADGTMIISMAMDKNDPAVLYVGTSSGIILKTVDGGETWRSIYTAAGPISKIIMGGGGDSHIYYLVYESQVLVSGAAGDNFKIVGNNLGAASSELGKPYSLAVSDNDSGWIYVGTNNGIFKSSNAGETFAEINVLATAKSFPIRSLAINPQNSEEIVYSAAQAIYRSVDGGKNWSTFQLNTGKLISKIIFNPSDVNTIYASLRSFQ